MVAIHARKVDPAKKIKKINLMVATQSTQQQNKIVEKYAEV